MHEKMSLNSPWKGKEWISKKIGSLKDGVVEWIQTLLKKAFIDQVNSSIIELDPDKRYLLFLPEKLSESLSVLESSETLHGMKLIIITTDSFRLLEF